MERFALKSLLEKYKKGIITPEELEQLEAWYLHWQPEAMDVSAEELALQKARVWQSLQLESRDTRSKRLWIPWAAAAAVLVLLGVGFYTMRTTSSGKPLAAAAPLAGMPQPGSNRAVLTLSTGQQLILGKNGRGILAKDADVTIRQTGNGQIAYGQQPEGKKNTEMNTLATPRGGQYHLLLADGTAVWLNAGSSITYPVAFDPQERRVTVTGEAYFEVAQRIGQPFKVLAGKAEIAVLGTHFNVKAYADDADMSATLLSGRVKITNRAQG
ncbi:MAG TPA: FecR domain-containing protein, partial [Chitinophaga sp.]